MKIKKIVFILVLAFITLVGIGNVNADTTKYGDINEDNSIDNKDMVALSKHINGETILTGQALLNADINGDGNVNNKDYGVFWDYLNNPSKYPNTLPDNPINVSGYPSTTKYGDINLDNSVDNKDMVALSKHINGETILTGQALINADINGDGNVNNKDYGVFWDYLNNPSKYPNTLPDNPINNSSNPEPAVNPSASVSDFFNNTIKERVGSILQSNNSTFQSISIDYLSYDVVKVTLKIDGNTYETNYKAYEDENGILVIEYLSSNTSKYDALYNFYLLDMYVKAKNDLKSAYDPYRFNKFIIDNKDNALTLANNNIEYEINGYLEEDEFTNLFGFNLSNEYKLPFYRAKYNYLYIRFVDVVNYNEPEIAIYNVTDGGGQNYNKDANQKMSFTIDASHELIKNVYIDNNLVDNSNYTVTSGSTIITFNEDYLKTLNNGNHELMVTYDVDDYEEFAKTSFKVFDAIDNPTNPSTGINMRYGIFALIAVAGLTCYLLLRKRSKFPKHD